MDPAAACLSPSCPSRHQTAPPPDGDADISLGSTWLAAPPRRLGMGPAGAIKDQTLWVDGPIVLFGDFNVGPKQSHSNAKLPAGIRPQF